MTIVSRILALDRVPKYIPVELVANVDTQNGFLANFSALPRFQKIALLEAILRTCEMEKFEVSELVYEWLAASLGSTEADEECVGSFSVQGMKILFEAAKEGSSFVQNGSTGFVTWEAAKCLAWYLCTRKETNIYELGCGTGITGIITSKLHQIQYYFTDYHESTLAQAQRNWVLNEMGEGFFEQVNICSYVGKFDFSNYVIVGADILYDTDLCDGLVRFLSNIGPFKEALIMSTIRTEATYARFIANLQASKLSFSVLKSSKMTEWIQQADGEWKNFLSSASLSFDPIIELVSIRLRQ